MNNVSISPKILKQMEQDPEKRMEYEALIYDIAHTDVQSNRAPGHKLKSHGFIIEDDGGLRSWGISESNEGNRRQIAATATQGDMQAVLAILQQDLQELEDGYKQNACDAAEVEKAKKLIEQAKQQMGRLPDRAPTMAESSTMTINMLI